MSISPLPQIASLGSMERVAYEVQVQPETQAAAAEANAQALFRKERERIQKSENGQEGERVADKDQSQSRPFHAPAAQKRPKRRLQDTPSEPPTPWSGNLLNVTI